MVMDPCGHESSHCQQSHNAGHCADGNDGHWPLAGLRHAALGAEAARRCRHILQLQAGQALAELQGSPMSCCAMLQT